LITKKKKGVELQMKFRNHLDPLYYDSNANKLVFVPILKVTTLFDNFLRRKI